MSLVQLYTAEEVAAAFRLKSPNWLEEKAQQKKIPHTRLGRQLRFTAEQAERTAKICAVEEQEPQPRPPTRARKTSPSADPPHRQPRRLQARVPLRIRKAMAAHSDADNSH